MKSNVQVPTAMVQASAILECPPDPDVVNEVPTALEDADSVLVALSLEDLSGPDSCFGRERMQLYSCLQHGSDHKHASPVVDGWFVWHALELDAVELQDEDDPSTLPFVAKLAMFQYIARAG